MTNGANASFSHLPERIVNDETLSKWKNVLECFYTKVNSSMLVKIPALVDAYAKDEVAGTIVSESEVPDTLFFMRHHNTN